MLSSVPFPLVLWSALLAARCGAVPTLTSGINEIETFEPEPRFPTVLNILRAVNSRLEEQDEQLEQLAAQQTKQDGRLEQLAVRLEEQDGWLTEQDARLEEQDARLEEQDGRLTEQDGRLEELAARLMEQDTRLEQQDGRLEEQNGRLEQLAARLMEQDGRLEQQDARLEEQDGRLEQLAARLEEQDGRPTEKGYRPTEQDGRLTALAARLDQLLLRLPEYPTCEVITVGEGRQFRLVGDAGCHRGRVQWRIKGFGQWHQLCDSTPWSAEDAAVACLSFGFRVSQPGVDGQLVGSAYEGYARGIGITCGGWEQHLWQCQLENETRHSDGCPTGTTPVSVTCSDG